MTPVIAATGLRKRYAASEPWVLDGCDLAVAAGERVAIVGPSGCGKSTLLALVAGLDLPDAGAVAVAGQALAGLDERARCRLRARSIGLVFQDHHLLPHLGALENVLMPWLALEDRPPRRDAEARAAQLLARVGLTGKEARRAAELSGGERQRVAVARAFMNRPQAVLADEPTGALDAATADEVAGLLLELNAAEGTALVVVTHAEGLARRMGRALAVVGGRLRAQGAAG